MSWLDLVLTLLTLIGSVTVIQFCIRHWNFRGAFVGTLIGVASLIYCGNPLYRWFKIRNLSRQTFTEVASPAEKTEAALHPGGYAGKQAVGIKTVWSQEALVFDLSTPGNSISRALKEASKTNRLMLFKAHLGIHEEYRAWVEGEFGAYREHTGQPMSFCFRRLGVFPYASGVCRTRSPRVVFEPGPTSYTIDRSARASSILIKQSSGSRFAMVTYDLGPVDKMQAPEEICLTELSKGTACAAVETVPGAALGALSLQAADPEQAVVLDEFKTPNPAVKPRALLPLQAPEAPLSFDVMDRTSPYQCEGLSEVNQRLGGIRELGFVEKLQQVQSEIDLANTMLVLDQSLSCPGLITFDVPKLPFNKTQQSTRSFMTQLMERPLWITTPRSYLLRQQKVQRTKLGVVGQTITLNTEDELKFAGLTVISPVTFDEELLPFIKASTFNHGFKTYRTGTTAFRVIGRSTPFFPMEVPLAPVLAGSDASNSSIVTDWSGFNRSLLFALSLAMFMAWMQSLATIKSERSAFATLTFFYIGFIALVWCFLSYRASLHGGLGDMAEKGEERGRTPQFLTIREWDEKWLNLIQDQDLEKNIVDKNKAAAWKIEVAQARRIADHADLQGSQMVWVDLAQKTVGEFARKINVALWDAPEIRNWYFRRSPVYSSALTAWQALMKKSGATLVFTEDHPDFSRLLDKATTLVIPDLRLLSKESFEAVSRWVEAGGTVVYHWNLDPKLNTDAVISSVGFKPEETLLKNYSQVPDLFGKLVEINRTHQVLKRTGNWYDVKPSGQGRWIFSGVLPSQNTSMELLTQFLHGIARDAIEVKRADDRDCLAPLMLQPYGAAPRAIREFTARLKNTRRRFTWAIDAESFARMAPEWEREFTVANLAFIDDGKTKNRVYAMELFQRFFHVKSIPSFVSLADAPPATAGPQTPLYRMTLLPAGETGRWSMSVWNSECADGFSRPRLLVASELSGHHSFWLEQLAGLPVDSFVYLENVFEHQQKQLHSTLKVRMKSTLQDPFVLEIERTPR